MLWTPFETWRDRKPRSVYGYYDGDFVTLWIRPVNDQGWARLRVVQEKKLPQVMIDAGDVHQIANINLVDALTDTTQYTSAVGACRVT